MVFLAKLMGLLIMGFGLTIFASPSFIQKVFTFFLEGKRIYYAGLVRVFTGIILFLAASRSVVPGAVTALGMMFLVSGIIIFAADQEKMMNFLRHYSEMPTLIIRLLGLVAAAFGILIITIFG